VPGNIPDGALLVQFGFNGDEIVLPDATGMRVAHLAHRAIKAAGKDWALHRVRFLISGQRAGPEDEPVPHAELRHAIAIGRGLRPPALQLVFQRQA